MTLAQETDAPLTLLYGGSEQFAKQAHVEPHFLQLRACMNLRLLPEVAVHPSLNFNIIALMADKKSWFNEIIRWISDIDVLMKLDPIGIIALSAAHH